MIKLKISFTNRQNLIPSNFFDLICYSISFC